MGIVVRHLQDLVVIHILIHSLLFGCGAFGLREIIAESLKGWRDSLKSLGR